jgi:hypothetical protein
MPGLAARALSRSQDAVNSAATRVARLPGVDFLIQQAHANPVTARVIGGIAGLIVALLAGAALLGPHGQHDPEQPYLPYAIPAATAPTSPPPAAATPSPTPPPAASTPNPSPTGSGAVGNSSGSAAAAPNNPGNDDPGNDNEAGAPSPHPTSTSSATPTQTSTSPPPPPCAAGCPIAFDATGLSYSSFKISGVTDDWVDSGEVRTLRLTPGTYRFQTPATMSTVSAVTFEVTADGKVDYSPSLGGFLSGAGESTLRLHGYAVGVDATPLSYQKLDLKVAGVERGFDSTEPQPLQLLPGTHRLEAPAKSFGVEFEVTADGKVGYDAGLGGLLSGEGTSTLDVRGYEIAVDARQTSYAGMAVQYAPGRADAEGVRRSRLVPGFHAVVGPGGQGAVAFTVKAGGAVDYARNLDDALGGRDSNTLVVRGYEIAVDPRLTSYTTMWVSGAPGRVDADGVRRARLVPGTHAVVGPGGYGAVSFSVQAGGTVDYAHKLDGALDGRDTEILVIKGYPIDIDATGLSSPSFSIDGTGSGMPTQDVQHLRLLPGTLRFRAATGLIFTFRVNSAGPVGSVDYDPSLDGFLDGRSTATLIVKDKPAEQAMAASGGAGASGGRVDLLLWPLWAAFMVCWAARLRRRGANNVVEHVFPAGPGGLFRGLPGS